MLVKVLFDKKTLSKYLQNIEDRYFTKSEVVRSCIYMRCQIEWKYKNDDYQRMELLRDLSRQSEDIFEELIFLQKITSHLCNGGLLEITLNDKEYSWITRHEPGVENYFVYMMAIREYGYKPKDNDNIKHIQW